MKKPKINEIITNIDDLGKDLLLRLFDYSLFTRITARDALLHGYFKEELVSTPNAQMLPDVSNLFQAQPNILKRKQQRNSNQQTEENTENIDPRNHMQVD